MSTPSLINICTSFRFPALTNKLNRLHDYTNLLADFKIYRSWLRREVVYFPQHLYQLKFKRINLFVFEQNDAPY